MDKLRSLLPFNRLWLASGIIEYVTGSILIIAAIIRFAYVFEIETFAGIALTVYVLLFAVILICTEASVYECRTWFYFLNFGWGKGLAHIFIACIMLGSGAAVLWVDVLTGVYLILAAIGQTVISVLHRASEFLKVEAKLKEIEKKKEEAEVSDN